MCLMYHIFISVVIVDEVGGYLYNWYFVEFEIVEGEERQKNEADCNAG